MRLKALLDFATLIGDVVLSLMGEHTLKKNLKICNHRLKSLGLLQNLCSPFKNDIHLCVYKYMRMYRCTYLRVHAEARRGQCPVLVLCLFL